MNMARISVVLSPTDTGFSEEGDWDSWTAYVSEHVDEHVGEAVDVDCIAWKARGTAGSDDEIRVASSVEWSERDALQSRLRDVLGALWESWCAEGGPGAGSSATL